MTVSTEVDHNEYTGNGVTTSFPYTFRIFHKSDLVVQVVDLNENITDLVLDTDYTVSGAGGYTGGNVILANPLPNGYQISISRELPVTQDTDLRNQGKFFAEVHEDAFDKLTMLIQQAFSWLRLALRKPSFVANYYDAMNNYIRNLRDPLQPQDAATKNYVDSLSNTNLSRTLRTPEPIISLPGIEDRKNKIVAMDNSGNPLMVLPESGSAADVLIELAKPSGAGLSGYDSSINYPQGTVGDALSKTIPVLNLALFTSLHAAIDSLPASGGKIVVPEGVYDSGDWTYDGNYMSKQNVAIIGEKMPTWNSDLSSLTGGSVIRGRFNVWAHNFQIENIGFDMGKTYVESKYPGKNPAVDPHPLGGTWDAFAFASPNNGSGPRRNIRIKNLVGLLYNGATVGHAVLLEGISEGSAENTVAIYGIHGNVIKAIQFYAKNLTSYGQTTNGTIIKSDTYALCGDVVIEGTYHAKQPIDTTPWSTPAKTENALCFNSGLAAFTGSILVNNTIAYDCANHLRPQGSIPIADIIVNGQKSERCDWPVLIDTNTNCLRMIVDNAIWSNCTQGAFVGQAQSWAGQSQLTLKSVKATNITNAVFYAMQNGLIVIDEVEAYNVNHLYNWQNGGRIYVGREKVSQLQGGNKFDPAGIAPILGPGWSSYDISNSQFDIELSDYKIRLSGLMKTSGTEATIIYLPESMRPSLPVRLPCFQSDSAGPHSGFLTINEGVQVGNNVLPAGLQMISIDSIEWIY